MAYRRRRKSYKKGRRPRRRMKRMMRRRRPRYSNGQYLTLKKTFRASTTWVWNAASTPGFWRYETYDVNVMPAIVDFANTFEEYKLCAVKYKYIPNYQNLTAGDTLTTTGGSSNTYQFMIAAEPRSGIQVPSGTYSTTTLNAFLAECNNVKTYNSGKTASIYYKPCVLEDTAGAGSVKYVRAPWIRTSNLNITHRAHHCFVWGINGADLGGLEFEIQATYYIKFRGAK